MPEFRKNNNRESTNSTMVAILHQLIDFFFPLSAFRRAKGLNKANKIAKKSEILTSITIVSDMPPSYDVAIENVTASHQKLFNSTKTELPNIFYSEEYEIGRLEKEIQRLNKIISTKDKLLKSILVSILVSILLIVIVNIIVITYFNL